MLFPHASLADPCTPGRLGGAGNIKSDHPQPPGRLVLVDLEAHPARLYRQARSGQIQPGLYLGSRLSVQQGSTARRCATARSRIGPAPVAAGGQVLARLGGTDLTTPGPWSPAAA
ncbi:MAG: hypothetical protein ACRDRA_05255 [Pseudonocardiaceae bacterium]